MDWFKGQFEQSNIISGVLAVVIWGAIIYLSVTGQSVPDVLIYGGSSVIAFFFGSKVGKVEGRRSAIVQSTEHIEEVHHA